MLIIIGQILQQSLAGATNTEQIKSLLVVRAHGQVLAAILPTHPPCSCPHIRESSGKRLQHLGLCVLIEYRGSWLQPGPVLPVPSIRDMNHWVDLSYYFTFQIKQTTKKLSHNHCLYDLKHFIHIVLNRH